MKNTQQSNQVPNISTENTESIMPSRKPLLVELTASISTSNQLILYFPGEKGPLPLRPGKGLEDLLGKGTGVKSLTIEVTDFYQYGAVYDVYGATLADDGRVIVAHWESTGRGRRNQFVVSASGDAGQLRFVIGATPRSPGAPVPIPFRSWPGDGGGFPDDDPPKTSG